MPTFRQGSPLHVVTYRRHGTWTTGYYLDMIAEGLAPSWITPKKKQGLISWIAYGREFGVFCNERGECTAISDKYTPPNLPRHVTTPEAKRARADSAFQLFMQAATSKPMAGSPSPLASE